MKDNTTANPLIGAEVAEVEQLVQLADSWEDSPKPPPSETDEAPTPPPPREKGREAPESKTAAGRSEDGGTMPDFDQGFGEDEAPDWGESGNAHIDATAYEDDQVGLADMIVDGIDWGMKELLYQRVKIPEADYLKLESDPDSPAKLKEAFRLAGFYETVREANSRIKGMLGMEEEDRRELARLGNILVAKHMGEVNVGPEGQFVMVLAKVGYQQYYIINHEIPAVKEQVAAQVNDGVEKVREMFKSKNQSHEAAAEA